MSKINDGGPAFPDSVAVGPAGDVYGSTGMTLRDYFAAKALSGMASQFHDGWTAPGLAKAVYELADAMLAERNKP